MTDRPATIVADDAEGRARAPQRWRRSDGRRVRRFGQDGDNKGLLFVKPIFLDLALRSTADIDHRATVARWSEAIDFIDIAIDELANIAWLRIPKPLRDVGIQSAGLAVEVR